MVYKDFHILVQQGIQAIESFADTDIKPEDIDYAAYLQTYGLIEDVMAVINPKTPPLGKGETKTLGLDDKQVELDKLRLLYIIDYELTPLATVTAFNYKSGTLPSNYEHIISDKSNIEISCKENGTLTTKNKIVSNTLVSRSIINDRLDSQFGNTEKDSPLSTIAGNKLCVYYNGFTVKNIYIDYIKSPKRLEYNGTPSASIITKDDEMELSNPANMQLVIKTINYLKEIINGGT